MKITRIFSVGAGVAFLSCIAVARLTAQEDRDPVPKEPLIPRAPDMSAWTITYRYKPTPADAKPNPTTNQKPPDQVTSVLMEKTGKTYHRVTTWSSGAQTDAWSVGARQVVKYKTAPTYVLMPSEGPETDDYTKSDFEDLTWITMQNYDGYKKGEHPVFVFQIKNTDRPMTRRDRFKLAFLGLADSLPATPKPNSKTQDTGSTRLDTKTVLEQIYGTTVATVVVDAKTQLPIAYDDGRIILAYQFNAAPTSTLVPPAEVTTLLRKFEDYARENTLHPSSP